MKKKGRWLLYPLLCLLLALSVAVPAFATNDGPPPMPHSFYGTVTIDGLLAPPETEVEAQGTGVMIPVEGNPITTTVEGQYGSSSPLGPWLVVQGYIDEGTPIEFYVNGVMAQCYDVAAQTSSDTYPFHSAAFTELNLTVGEVPPPQYDLTVASTAGGSVTEPGEGTFPYDPATVVNLVAVPDEGYDFVNWTGDVGTVADTSAASTTITMNGDYSITANFALIGATYNLTVASTDGGSVTTPGEGVQGPYDPGVEVPLLAEPDTGYEFVNWTGEVTTVADVDAASTTINMDGDYSITANFGEIGVTYSLTVASTDGGSVTDPGEGTFLDYPAGTPVDLLAEADTGYLFVNWTGNTTDIADVNGASTTITMNGDYSITANFVEVTGDLGDEIADTPSGGTVQLLTGTYTGDVIIDKPITITGTEGTVISGGIHIVPLTGSNVTIENVTITDYTAYGIRIELVGADDVFIIRNNIIEGVVGSLIGIKVDRVDAGGSLNIRNNAISDNEIGIKLLADVADATIHFNDITGNTVFGLEQLAVVSDASAIYNWWGDISGPEYEAASFESWPNNPGGLGDAVSDNVDFMPWLTRDFQTVLDDNIAYLGYPMICLNTGWNIISTPIALDPVVEWEDSGGIARTGVQTWGDYVDLGDGLAIDTDATTYYFDGEIQDYVQVLGTHRLKPCDAIYVKMAEPDVAAILLSPSVSVPSKQLYAGWNLVSLAWLGEGEIYAMPADETLLSVSEVTGDLTGYVLVVSPSVNQTSWIYTGGTIEDWTDPLTQPPPDGWMEMTNGYWVFMLNEGTLAGFTFTPISLD